MQRCRQSCKMKATDREAWLDRNIILCTEQNIIRLLTQTVHYLLFFFLFFILLHLNTRLLLSNGPDSQQKKNRTGCVTSTAATLWSLGVFYFKAKCFLFFFLNMRVIFSVEYKVRWLQSKRDTKAEERGLHKYGWMYESRAQLAVCWEILGTPSSAGCRLRRVGIKMTSG